MKKTVAIILLSILAIAILYPSVCANDTGVLVDQELVTISPTNTGLLVEEGGGGVLDPTRYPGCRKNHRIAIRKRHCPTNYRECPDL